MFFDFLSPVSSQPSFIIWIQQFFYNIMGLWRKTPLFIPYVRPFHIQCYNILKNFFNRVCVERGRTYQKFIHNDTKTPPIKTFILYGFTLNNFGGNIVRSTDNSFFLFFFVIIYLFLFFILYIIFILFFNPTLVYLIPRLVFLVIQGFIIILTCNYIQFYFLFLIFGLF